MATRFGNEALLAFGFRIIRTELGLYIYIKPFSDEINFVSIGHLQRRIRDSSP